jgi:hypothetical protein
MRINKRQRRKRRESAKSYEEEAKLVELENPDRAESLRRIAAYDARLGAPPKSKKRRSKKKISK